MWEIWTDGSSQGKRFQQNGRWISERGGYSAVITKNGKIIKKLYQGYNNTTNNRMELMGVLAGLKYFQTSEKIKIYSDSQYIVNSINNKHVFKWFEEKDFSKKNLDIWHDIVDLLEFHDVSLEWVKGHANNKGNELSDLLAVHACNCLNRKDDLNVSTN